MSMKLSGVAESFKQLNLKIKSKQSAHDLKIVSAMTEELKAKTPVDTGNARNSWSTTPSADGFNTTNSAEYIEYLNGGSSQQAPAFFIERTALKYGTPKGAIVEPLK